MDIKPSRLVGDKNERGRRHVNNMVCSFWLHERCNRNPCRFLHQELPQNTHYQVSNQFRKNCWQRNPDSDLKSASSLTTQESSSGSTTPKCSLASNQSHRNNGERSLYSNLRGESDSTNPRCSSSPTNAGGSSGDGITQKVIGERVCKYWLHGNCVWADKCQYLHSWFKGHGVSKLAELNGHNRPSLECCFLLAQRSSKLPVEMGIYGFGTAILVTVMVWSTLEGKSDL